MKLKAPAKINLSLSILGKLENNYHQVKTVYTQISLFDLIEIEEIKSELIEIKVNWKGVPVDETNLVWQAVELIKQKTGVKKGVRIKLKKQIPVGSGLGGGSSDAAVVLKGLNKFWELGLSLNKLVVISKKIGADVAYQLMGGVKLEAQGGDRAGRFENLGKLPEGYLVICVPEIKRSSQQAYQEVDYTKIGKNDLFDLVRAVKKRDLKMIGENLHNDFEIWTISKFPEVKVIKEKMIKKGAEGALMSGKGLAVFGLFKTKIEASRAWRELKKDYNKSYLAEPYYGD